MAYRIRERVIFDVVDEATEEVVTSTVERETADGVVERLENGALQHTPGPVQDEAPQAEEQPFRRAEDDEPIDVGGSNIT